MITAYAAIIQTLSGAHQKSSGSTRVLPSTMNATTSPMFEGLNTCEPRYLITYFVSSENAATPAKTYQLSVFHGWSGGVPTTRRIRATPLPVSIALAGQTNIRVERNVSATSITRGREDRREDLRDAHPEVEPDLAQDVDRDDHRRDVEPGVADVRQDQRVGGPAEAQRPGRSGHGRRGGVGRARTGRVTDTWDIGRHSMSASRPGRRAADRSATDSPGTLSRRSRCRTGDRPRRPAPA